jgi:hypothetical protein
MYWKDTIVDIGEVKENSKTYLSFTAEEETPEIKEIVTSCGCSKVKLHRAKGLLKTELHVTLKHSRLPNHLPVSQNITRTVTLHYKNRTFDKIVITGKIVKNE